MFSTILKRRFDLGDPPQKRQQRYSWYVNGAKSDLNFTCRTVKFKKSQQQFICAHATPGWVVVFRDMGSTQF